MKQIHLGIFLSLLFFGSVLSFFWFQESRIASYCNNIQKGETIISARMTAQKAFHDFRLANGSELVVEPKGPRLAPIRCRVFFDRFRTVAASFFEQY